MNGDGALSTAGWCSDEAVVPSVGVHSVADMPAGSSVTRDDGLWGQRAGFGERTILAVAVGLPFAALIAALIFAGGSGVHAVDLILLAAFYLLTGFGISIGYHRLFTHRAFKAGRTVRVFLAVLATAAIEGDVFTWAADHRRHHQFSDRQGDPHSPWRFGTGPLAVAKGMAWAHFGWMFVNEHTNQEHYVPDLLADRDLARVVRLQPLIIAASLALPAAIGGLLTWSWVGALSAVFWAGLVRISLLHHVTWSINSICHAFGDNPYRSHDRSQNVWWLAIPSCGEAWHNYHHTDPSSARHGVGRWQLDMSARVIWGMEKTGLATSVAWPTDQRIASRRLPEQPSTTHAT